VGPDLRGVTQRREHDWLVGFITNPNGYLETDPIAKELLAQYNGVRMLNLGLSREEAEGLIGYLKAAGGGPGAGADERVAFGPQKLVGRVGWPYERRGPWMPGVALFGLLVIAAGGAWKFAGRPVGLIILVLAGGEGYLAFGGHYYYRNVGSHQGYEPVQPIAYSHAQHAGDLEIACLYCHHGAEKSPVAGVPSVDTCMNCHNVVKTAAGSEEPSAEIQKVLDVWQTKDAEHPQSIEWVRVHRLPDFVYFSHQVHVQNGIQCQECHGPIETMARVRQVSALSMGWCLGCHRRKGPDAPTHWKRSGATTDCAACHR